MVKKSVFAAILIVIIVLVTGCKNTSGSTLTTDKAYKLIEDTFKLNVSGETAFPVDERLRYCANTTDCVFVWTDYCGPNCGTYGYLNSKYQEKWDDVRIKWVRNNTLLGGCFAAAPKTTNPMCVNHVCNWEKIPRKC